MCGIAGLVDPSIPAQIREEAVQRMCSAMIHRGPDDLGIASSGPATIGMRRLAIFDPANGHQPMATPDGRHTLVFNLNLSTKSGSNNFHGEGYEYIRNKVLNANNWFSNNASLGRPPFTQNQFGANVGGRVWRDRFFFFYSYEGFRLRQGLTYTGTVPDATVRAALAANANGTPTDVDLSSQIAGTISDPCGGNYNPYGTNLFGEGGCSGSGPTPVAFPGDVIPAARVNSTDAKLFIRAYPAPNFSGAGANYAANYGAGGNQNQNAFRIDQTITDKQHIFGRFTQWNNLNQPPDPLGR